MSMPVFWTLFAVLVLTLLAVDLLVFNRKSHEVKLKEALAWSAAWISLGLIFNAVVFIWKGKTAGIEFLAGYLLEYSLSVDNLFVFLLLFNYFAVPAKYQHRVLFWGILGALIMRAVFIGAGVGLIHRFEWLLLVFGIILIWSGLKMAFAGDSEMDPGKNPILKFCKKHLRLTHEYRGEHFFVRENGLLFATPLFLVLIMVETTDVIFAVDSIPAIIGITKDPFIIYTSNVFAILGLRSLYFALAGVSQLFHHLKMGLSLILIFIGAKMMAGYIWDIHVPTAVSLGVIAGVLLASIAASLVWPKSKQEQKEELESEAAHGAAEK